MFAQIGSFIVGTGVSTRDVLQSPVVSGASIERPVVSVDPFMSALQKYGDYLANPPDDYETSQAQKIGEWAAKQEPRLKDAIIKMEQAGDFSERYDDLDDKLFRVRQLVKKSKDCVEGDQSWGGDGPSL